WWDRRDGDERSALGEWMSDKFVAQVWCNRAMLVATGRDFMNPGEPGLAAKDDRTTFLDVIQRLVSRPTAVGVVLVDGTKVIPSRYLYPSTKAAVEAAHRDRSGSGDGGQPDRFVFLKRLAHHAWAKAEGERQRRREQQGVKTSSSSATTVAPPQDLKPLPEINYYIGTLELSLGFDVEAMAPGPEDTNGVSPTVTGTTKSGYPSDDEGKGGRTGASAVATITRALWPPEYILDTVVQPLFMPEEKERATSPIPGLLDVESWGANQRERKEQGIIIVSSVNCGYVDMASNFLQSVNDAAGDVKVLFVARDELAFDFLDAVSPGCTVLFPEAGSVRR
ncbi:unnamed protein product, partial [Ectocarpus fasciculatus]